MLADPAKLHVMRNGVDLERFRPEPQAEARAKLGWGAGHWLLSVGHLIERKGHHIAIEALTQLPQVTLLIAGSGPDRAKLEALATRLGVADQCEWRSGSDREERRGGRAYLRCSSS